jgi:hypothetical protein
VLAAEHFLGFTRLDLTGQLVEGAAEIVGDRLASLGPFDEHVQIVEAAAQ